MCFDGIHEINNISNDVLRKYRHCVSMQSETELAFRGNQTLKGSSVLFHSETGLREMLKNRFRYTFSIANKETLDDPSAF